MHLALDEHLRLCIRAEAETSSDALLAQLCLSRKTRYLHYAGRRISCNGRLLAQDHPLHAGDTLIIDPIMPEETITPWDHPVDVLHEDELFAIINKESGLLVHSDGNNTEHTVCNALRHHFIQSAQPHVPVRPLHRLDVGTSGILLFCKYPLLQPLLDQMMETHQIRRSYLAVVNGHFPAQRQEYCDPIGRDRHDARRMIVCRSGKPALTRVTLLRYNKKKDRSLVRCVLETGRTHQIRVHLSTHGFPLIHDTLYGHGDGSGRLALHSAHVELWHPLRQMMWQTDCPLPLELEKMIR